MELHNNLFLGEGLKNPQKLIEKLNKGHILKNFYIVGFECEKDKPEIINSRMFFQKFFRNMNFFVVAIFISEEEAFEYIRCLCELSQTLFDNLNLRKAVDELSIFEIKEIFNKEDL